jgi:hypothetical protein
MPILPFCVCVSSYNYFPLIFQHVFKNLANFTT